MDIFQTIYNTLLYSNQLSHKIHYKKYYYKKFFNYDPYNIGKKYNIIRKIVYNENLESEHKKKCVEQLFYYSQKYYFLISKYAYKYKMKKIRTYHNNCDLNMIPFEEIPEKLLIRLYDKCTNLIYVFRISDLIQIINNNLAYMEDYKFTAKHIKNPYTNIKFNKSTLYNIYFKLKFSTFIMPQLFHLFFLLDFNLKKHIIYNNTNIRQYAIKQYIQNASIDIKKNIIDSMFEFFKSDIEITFINEIDKFEFVNIFNSHIYLYILYLYSNNRYLSMYSRQLLFKKFINFSKYNKNHNISLICDKNIMNKPFIILEYYNDNEREEITNAYFENTENRENRENTENTENFQIDITNNISNSIENNKFTHKKRLYKIYKCFHVNITFIVVVVIFYCIFIVSYDLYYNYIT